MHRNPMKLTIERPFQEKDYPFTGTVRELLMRERINSENVLVVKNNNLVNLDEKIEASDTVKILSVISGG